MKKLLYYRPNTGDAELITSKQRKRLIRLWGTRENPYNHLELFEEDGNYGTGLHVVTEILATIQCDKNLNSRITTLISRLAKGTTYSKVCYKGNSKTVEAGIFCRIVEDAIEIFNKSCEEEDKIEFYKFPMREAYRLFEIPYKSIMDEVKRQEEKIGDIPEPKKFHKVKYHYPVSKGGDQQGCYKEYFVKGKLSFDLRYGKSPKNIYKIFPYLGKIHEVSSDNYIQIYVYDYNKRDWAFQNVIDYLIKDDYLIKEGKTTLE
jgi:hypothetical protein